MPGRQAHGRPVLAGPPSQKKSNRKGSGGGGGGGSGSGAGRPSRPKNTTGRRVDVLALAEQQISETKTKGVRLRDLDIEREQPKRRRGEGDDDDDDEDEDGGDTKRRRRGRNNDDDDIDESDDEIHSDSEGNEWHVGVGSEDDDSEIDSDEAFGDSDNEMFEGYSFRGSTAATQMANKKKKAVKKGRSGGDDDFEGFDSEEEGGGEDVDEDVGDDGAALGDDAIDLAQALDQVSSSDEEAEDNDKTAKKAARRKAKRSKQASDSDLSADEGSEQSSLSGSDDEDSDDDDDDEDEELSSTASSEYDEDEEDEEDGVDDAKVDALRSIAEDYSGKKNKDTGGDDAEPSDNTADVASLYKISAQFDAKDRSLKAILKPKASIKLDVPLPRMVQDRQLRAAAAEKAHETLDRWTDTVKHNRRAEHLTFAVAGSLETSGLDTTTLLPIDQKSAQTELEKTILSIMEESGLGPKAVQAATDEQKKSGLNAEGKPLLSPEELKALVSQKRRQRELQSREQARARRIKKIKSKAYRRVHRRERAKLEALLADDEALENSDGGGGVDSEEEREAQHRRRAMERMGSRHRESKWAKRAKNTGRAAWDDEFRAGLVDMARQDEELRRRVEGRIEGRGPGGDRAGESDSSDSEEDDDDDDGDDDEAFKLRTLKKLEQADSKSIEGTPSALMNIAFMQKAELARKKANDDAVAEIMRELDPDNSDYDGQGGGNGDDDDDGADKVVGRRTYGVANAGQASVRNQRQRAAAAATSANNDKIPQRQNNEKSVQPNGWAPAVDGAALLSSVQVNSAPGEAGSWTVVPKAGARKAKKGSNTDAKPTLAPGGVNAVGAVEGFLAKNKEAAVKSAVKPAAMKVAATAGTPNGNNNNNDDDSDTSSSGSDSDDDEHAGQRAVSGNVGTSSSFFLKGRNAVLLEKALGDDDGAAEFAREKARLAAEEAEERAAGNGDGRDDRNQAMPGWGSWVGDGISKRAQRREQHGNRQLAGGNKGGKNDPAAKKASARRDAKLDRVIISERRVRKNDKYLASQLPHEFESRSQYERSLRLPVGPEWTTKTAFQDATKPRVLMKQGVVLPMAKPLV
ncbi:small nucleolar ribonucleoprotein complex subunit putatrive [Niveomyces insectorum RCEF 264]|uniref:Small nucleolar ribonucleoprotein complex subunit putatrive n=1 Tax=Niveomyces insectorum RCEF 264 TaxID=1081102 RepID=A0A167WUG8_9HYPO|nr:small nucleolar ribonucleoprotein complex subunit putatrive [Niveomyces insectorum RCEF 264]